MHTIASSEPLLSPDKVEQLEHYANELLEKVPTHPIEPVIEEIFKELFEVAKKGE